MEAEKELDLFASIIELCQPTASQEAKFPNCPLARESENFADSNSDQLSSSPDPTPSEPTGIVIVSPPDSPNSVHQQVEDDAVFHTPPEHPVHSHLSSSEDQNLNELCAEGVRTTGVEVNSRRSKKVRVFEGGSDDESELKKSRVAQEEFGGETVPVGETEVIADEIERNKGVHDTEIIVVDSSDSGEETATTNSAEDSLDIISEGSIEVGKNDVVQKNHKLMKDGVPEVSAIDENHELGKKCESMEGNRVNKGEKAYENSDLSGGLDRGKGKEKIVKPKCIVGNECIKFRQENGVGGSEKVVKVTENDQMLKDGYGDGSLRSNGKRIEEIDEFRYVAGGDVEMRRKGGTGTTVGGSGRRRQLPVSMKGKEKNMEGGNLVETSGTMIGLLDFMDILKVVVGDMDGGCADVDFLETAKRRGLTFARPRWWPSQGDDE